MNPPVSIIIPAFNELSFCEQCVYSIQINTKRAYKLILVDNGSTDGVPAFFDSVEGATVVHSETNLGFAGGVNIGLEHAEGHVVLLNSDTLVPLGWIERLENAMLSSEDMGMVGPMSNYVSGPQQIDGLELKSLEEVTDYATRLAEEKSGQLTDALRLVGFCVMIRDSVFEGIGKFDESFGTGNFEDDDYCFRVSRAGYRLGIAEDCFVFHYGNRTFTGMEIDSVKWDALMAKNRQVFIDKWGIIPESRSHPAFHSREFNTRARKAYVAGNLQDAEKLLHKAIHLYPGHAENYNDLGAILYVSGDHLSAYEYFIKALKLKKDYQEARDNLRDIAEIIGKQEESSEILGNKI